MNRGPSGEPALWFGLLAPLFDVAVALKFPGVTADTKVAIIAAINAVAGAAIAWRTRPLAPGAFTAALSAVVALFAGYGYEISPNLVAAISGMILAVVALITRHQVEPVAATPERMSAPRHTAP
jgi:hypothetical protein